MGFPILIAAIRNSGLRQWNIAAGADITESRLSRIVCRGVATPAERARLSRLLGIDEDELFGPGPKVSVDFEGARRSLSST